MKLNKKVLIPMISVLAVVVVIAGIFLILRMNREPVLVVPVTEVGTSDESFGGNSLYGYVRTDRMQAIYLSETQTVTGFRVQEGDTVKAGDPLLDYDTSLTDLQLQRKELEIRKQERALENAQKEYKQLFGQTFRLPEPTAADKVQSGNLSFPVSGTTVLHFLTETTVSTDDTEPVSTQVEEPTEPTETEPTEPESTEPVEPTEPTEEGVVTEYERVGGTGTEENPYLYVIADDYAMDTQLLETILGAHDSVTVVFAQCMDNRVDGIVTAAFGMTLERTAAGGCSMRLNDASEYVGAPLVGELPGGGDDPIVGPDGPGGGGMTHEELMKLRAEKEQEMIEMDLNLRMARVEYKRMQAELGDGTVYAELDGVVVAIGDPETAFLNGEAVLKVSGGGGYNIEGTVSELSLDDIMIGRTVTVTSWNNGMQYEGVITEISNVPTSSGGWSDGNNNVSYYPFTVVVDETAELMDGEYVDMQLAGESGSTGFYLETPFILQENGKSYIYAANENGKLEKREVVTGKDLWGSYLEIRSGVTPEDWIAFPYGKNVTEGAKTKQGTASELYGG